MEGCLQREIKIRRQGALLVKITTVHVLGAKAGAIRSLKYSSNGAYLAAAEHIDFVHVYDTTAYESSQVIDMFGEISGISFTPDNQALYVANTDEQVG
ncbi:hypothetical protein DFQ30_006717 [Apophysomyces sp. BC1015]|nr:hypothetical protein DFQ30_006717 [Apophysomyces sp. BC1015]